MWGLRAHHARAMRAVCGRRARQGVDCATRSCAQPMIDAGRWNKSIRGSLIGHKASRPACSIEGFWTLDVVRRAYQNANIPGVGKDSAQRKCPQRKHRRRVAGMSWTSLASRPLLALTALQSDTITTHIWFSILAHWPMLPQGYLLPRRTSVHGHTHWRWLKDSPTKASAKGGRDLGPVFGPGHHLPNGDGRWIRQGRVVHGRPMPVC
jgi:hypothetical protein